MDPHQASNSQCETTHLKSRAAGCTNQSKSLRHLPQLLHKKMNIKKNIKMRQTIYVNVCRIKMKIEKTKFAIFINKKITTLVKAGRADNNKYRSFIQTRDISLSLQLIIDPSTKKKTIESVTIKKL